MKSLLSVKRTDAHDRLEHVIHANQLDIGKQCQKIIDSEPFGTHPFYIFAHKRQIGCDEKISIFQQDVRDALINPLYIRRFTSLDQVPTDRLIWQARLTKPAAQTNSMLFKAKPGSDCIRVIWMIPERELWDQYLKGNMTENKTVCESIYNFQHNLAQLEAPESDDLTDEQIKSIYKELVGNGNTKKIENIL